MDKQIIKRLLQKDVPIVLEIGTATGEDTKSFLKEFSNIRLYCFEPDPRCIKIHKNKVEDPRCKLYEVAISDIDGQIEFYQSGGQRPNSTTTDDWKLSSSIKKPKEHLKKVPWCTFDNKITVKTSKLDTWAQENKIEEVDFIWADVQGAEENLIKGGLETLSRTKYFYTEFDNKELYEGQINLKQLKALLPDFKVIGYYENNVLLKKYQTDRGRT